MGKYRFYNLAFFASGLIGLTYEVLWSRVLSLFLGSSVVSHALILSCFMGGLGIGAVFGGFYSKKFNNPFKVYGIIEILIGLAGSLSYLFYSFERKVLAYNLSVLNWSYYLSFLFIIIICTALMGATFPILYDGFERVKSNVLKNVSKLYWLNTFGAACAVLLTTFYLVPYLGLTHTFLLLVSGNICIGFFSLYLSIEKKKKKNLNDIQSSSLKRVLFCSSRVRVFYLLNGFITLAYEALFARAFHFSLGSSLYSFSIILFCFLVGITLGSFYVEKRLINLNTKQLYEKIADFQIKAFIFGALAVFTSCWLPYFMYDVLHFTSGSFLFTLTIEFIILSLSLIPLAFYLGGVFPLLIHQETMDVDLDSKEVLGRAYLFSTIGNVIGALFLGVIFIPWIGPFKSSLVILFAQVIFIAVYTQKFIILRKIFYIVPTLSVCVFFVFNFIAFDETSLTKAAYAKTYGFSNEKKPDYLKKFNIPYSPSKKEKIKKSKLLYFEHGYFNSVAVNQVGGLKRLILDGKTDATIGPFFESDMPTQVLLGVLPVLFAPKLENGLVIGLGSGVTTGVLSKLTQNVISLEIEKKVIEAQKYFSDFNENVGSIENVTIKLTDARKFVRQSKSNSFDYISAEPTNIWMAGVANLFSLEYFKDCERILGEDGVMVQWVHTYKLRLKEFKIILETFKRAFPKVIIIGSLTPGDLFLIGSYKDINTELIRIDLFRKNLKSFKYLEKCGFFDPEIFQNAILNKIDSSTSNSISPEIHREDKPILEYFAPIGMYGSQSREIIDFLAELN